MNYNTKFIKLFLLHIGFLSLIVTANSMIFNDFEENHATCYLTRLPKELTLRVSSVLEFKELLHLRQTSKALKGTVQNQIITDVQK